MSLQDVRIRFAALGISFVGMIFYYKRKACRREVEADRDGLSEFLDWMEPESYVSNSSSSASINHDSKPVSDNILYRSLASLGLAPTAPREARIVRDPSVRNSRISDVHPATGNDDVADDVVRIVRVSEAEEADRYFAAFSYN